MSQKQHKAKINMSQNAEEIKLPFESSAFAIAWNEWTEYRKERKLPKYVPRGLKMTFKKLVRESDNNEDTAIAMIEQSMEQNYQGIFPLKTQNNGIAKTSTAGVNKTGRPGTSEARIARAKEW